MAIDPLVINNTAINGNKVEILERYKYVGEMIIHNVNEKAAWDKEQRNYQKFN